MLPEDGNSGDICGTATPFVDNNAREMTPLFVTLQPIRRQSDESGHKVVVPLADSTEYAMTSSECVYQCPLTDDIATHSADENCHSEICV